MTRRVTSRDTGSARRVGLTLGVVGLLVASLTGCGRVFSHFRTRSPARGTTTIDAGGVQFNAIVRGPSLARAHHVVLFLHGASYTSRIWDDRGILDAVAAKGDRAVAVDLPGSGHTPARPDDDTVSLSSSGTLLRDLVHVLGGPSRVVVVSPSASGEYSLGYLAEYPNDHLAGFVGVAPVGITSFHRQAGAVSVPALLVWGANDHTIPFAQAAELQAELPGSRVDRIPGASHAAYDDHPKEFEALLLTFLAGLPRRGG